MIRDLNTKPFVCKTNALPIELIIQWNIYINPLGLDSVAVRDDPLTLLVNL